MDPARFALALPDDPDLLARLTAELATQGAPRVDVRRSAAAVLAFEAPTGEMMLRRRGMQALEAAAGPDWQRLVRSVE